MRLPPETIKEITGLSRPKYQANWFRLHFGVDVPCDRTGYVQCR